MRDLAGTGTTASDADCPATCARARAAAVAARSRTALTSTDPGTSACTRRRSTTSGKGGRLPCPLVPAGRREGRAILGDGSGWSLAGVAAHGRCRAAAWCRTCAWSQAHAQGSAHRRRSSSPTSEPDPLSERTERLPCPRCSSLMNLCVTRERVTNRLQEMKRFLAVVKKSRQILDSAILKLAFRLIIAHWQGQIARGEPSHGCNQIICALNHIDSGVVG